VAGFAFVDVASQCIENNGRRIGFASANDMLQHLPHGIQGGASRRHSSGDAPDRHCQGAPVAAGETHS